MFRDVFDDDSISAGADISAHDVDGWNPPSNVNRGRLTPKELLTTENVAAFLAGIPKKES
jgi:hypothetical protein